jgi:hypothetical protein
MVSATPGLSPQITDNGSDIQIPPLPLNPKDGCTVQALVSGYESASVGARIAGVSVKARSRTNRTWIWWAPGY